MYDRNAKELIQKLYHNCYYYRRRRHTAAAAAPAAHSMPLNKLSHFCWVRNDQFVFVSLFFLWK